MKRSIIIFAFLLVCVLLVTADGQVSAQEISGAKIFNDNCRVCHQNGGNIINPSMPLRGSLKLATVDTFLSFIRDPRMPDGSEGSWKGGSV